MWKFLADDCWRLNNNNYYAHIVLFLCMHFPLLDKLYICSNTVTASHPWLVRCGQSTRRWRYRCRDTYQILRWVKYLFNNFHHNHTLDILVEIIHSTKINFIFLFNMATAKSLQSCPTLCNPMDCSPPGFSVHGLLQARIVEWIAMPSSRGSSWPRDQAHVSYVSWAGSLLVPPALGHLKIPPETCYISLAHHCPGEWEACLVPLL